MAISIQSTTEVESHKNWGDRNRTFAFFQPQHMTEPATSFEFVKLHQEMATSCIHEKQRSATKFLLHLVVTSMRCESCKFSEAVWPRSVGQREYRA